MKNPIIVIALLASTLAGVQAQVTGNATQTSLGQPALPAPTAYGVVEQGANHRVWERTVYEPGLNGTVVGRKHRYTELASGLNFCDPTTGQWTPSKEQIDLLPPGGAFAAQAVHGQHQAWFPLDIAQGVIQLATPDGKQLQSRPIALAYDDGNQTMIFAILTNSIGELVGSNQVIYPDAFEGATASLRYTYTKAGFEQDVIVQGQLPTPDSFGLNRATAKLFVMTEFFDNNNPEETDLPVNPADGLSDAVLTFGTTMKMVGGQAFSIGTSDQSATPTGETPTYKSWVRLNGRKFLIEQVPYSRVAPQLEQLPTSGRVNAGNTNLMAMNSILSKGSAGALLPQSLSLKPETGNRNSEMIRQLARTDEVQTLGLVLDYKTLNSNQTNFVFQGDTTYYISGNVDLFDSTTIEGGTVIKYNATGQPSLAIYYGTVNCLAAPYRPAVFTAIDDNTVGETISGSTGSPVGRYEYYGLAVYYPPSPVYLQDLRISYPTVGIYIGPNGIGGQIRDSQICRADYAFLFSTAGSFVVENVLICQANLAFFDVNTTIPAAQLTINKVGTIFVGAAGGTLYLTNSLLVEATNSSGNAYTSVNNATNNSSAAVFQTVGAASHYLANNSSYRTNGTANIDPWLLADIAHKTTYPPIVYSNITFSITTNFSPQAQRDTNSSPDLGYHYDPLDYVFGGVNVYSNLTFTAGTAMGYFEQPGSGGGGGYGISIFDNVILALNGTASLPCTVARYSAVQEGGTGMWTDRGWLAAIAGQSLSGGYGMDPANAAQVWPNFTRHSALAGDPPHYRELNALLKVAAQNSEFWGSGVGAYWEYLNFTNCLFDRSGFGNLGGNPAICGVRNCTMHGGSVTLHKYGLTWPVWIEECAFDGTTFSVDDNSYGNTNITYCDFNAFLSNSNRLPMLGAHDVTNLLSFNWQSSWLGNYYLPPNSPLTNAGSTTADQVGLYHFTTQTNQVPETNSVVDIGYHYVAMDTNGVPLDSNGDGIPDYLEDPLGNGLPYNGTNWALAILTQPTNQLANLGNSPAISVTAGGIAPITYQWYSNSVAFTGQTNATLAFSNVQTNSDGSYFVIVTNHFGSITSSVATLTVVPPPTVLITNPANNAVFAASSTNITLQATASDVAGTISQVQFFQGTISLGIVTNSSYSLVWSNATAGNYALTAVALDNGLAATSPVVNITISPVFENSTMTLWLKADALGLPNGASISTWPDSSGAGNNVTQSSAGAQPSFVKNSINGYPVVNFNPTNYTDLGGGLFMNIPESLQTANGFMNTATGVEALVVLRVTEDPADYTNNANWPPGTIPGRSPGLYAQGCWYDSPHNNSPDEAYPNTDGSIQDDFETALINYLGVPAQSLTQYHIYEVSSQSNNWSAWINGILLYQSNTNAFGTGVRVLIPNNSRPFGGDIPEVLIFNRGLTVSERATVNSYLNGKYGLVTSVPATPSNLMATAISTSQVSLTWSEPLDGGATQISIERSTNSGSGFAVVAQVADALSYVDTNLTAGTTYYYQARAINVNWWSLYSNQTNATTLASGAAMPLGNLVMWLKADSGLAQIGTNTPVSFWADQSGNGNDLIQSSDNIVERKSWTNQPIWISGATGGFPMVHFTATDSQYECLFNYKPMSGTNGMTGVEAFAVARVTTNSPVGTRGLWYYGGANPSSETYPATNGVISDGFGSATIHSFTPTVTLTNYHVYEVASQSTNWSAWINGVLQYSTSTNTVQFGGAFDIGAVCAMDGYSAPQGNPFDGDVAEVLIFNQGLTSAQRATVVTNYLFSKYCISH